MPSVWLDWAVVAIPTLIGFAQLAFPISKAKKGHRVAVLVGCVLFSVLLVWQQWEARKGRQKEVTELPGQVAAEIIKILPTKTEPIPQAGTSPTANATQRWELTSDQMKTLSMRMKFYASDKARGDLITCVLGNPDSTKFATELVTVFRDAEWNLPGSGLNQAIFSGLVTGVILKVHSADSRPPGFSELIQSMREAGIEPTGEINEKIPENEFQIIVGAKP